jgi:hypothetical protein
MAISFYYVWSEHKKLLLFLTEWKMNTNV